MPICADPTDTMPLCLSRDKSIPDDKRPTFYVRFLTDTEHRKLRRLLDAAIKESDEEKAADLIEEALRVGIVGCKNIVFRGQPIEFSQIKRFGELFTTHEVSELAYGQLKVITLGERDRFFSESQRDSEPEKSVPDAETVAK